MDSSSRSDSSSTAAPATGQSQMSRSSENSLCNTAGSLGNVVSPSQICPQDYLEPVQILSVRAERTVTDNELSSVGTNALPPRSDLKRARVISLYSCGWFEIAVLNMSVLVILLSASSLMMVIMILAGVVSIDRSAPTPIAATDPVVSPNIPEQKDILMVLRNRIELINSSVNRITNQTVQDQFVFQSRFDGFQSQLVVFNQSIQSDNISRPILLDKANVSINTEQTCVMDEQEVCSLQQVSIACSGGQESVVNQNSGFLTEFSCYLNSTGFINGSAALVTASSTPTNRSSRAFTLEEVQDVGFLQGCFCFLFSLHSETVQCIRRSLRCSLSVPSLPFNVVV